jgi:hypothetical protein
MVEKLYIATTAKNREQTTGTADGCKRYKTILGR